MRTLKQQQNRAALTNLRAQYAAEQSAALALTSRSARVVADAFMRDAEPAAPPATTISQFVVNGGRATVAATLAAANVAVVDEAIAIFDDELPA